MEPIEIKSLKEQVLDYLRAAIMSGELKPGQPLVGSELGHQLGVSNATLREAIQTLSVEGLVDSIPYRVPTVKDVSRKSIEDLFTARIMLEEFAVRRIIASDQLKDATTELHRICSVMQQAAEQNTLQDVNKADRHFHETLIRYSNNELLSMFWNSVEQRVQQVMSLKNREKGDLFQITRNHVAIVEAIESADVEESTRLINEHIGSVGDELADSWVDNQNDASSDTGHS